MFTDLIQQLLFYINEQIVRFLTCICVRSQPKYGYLIEFRVSKSLEPICTDDRGQNCQIGFPWREPESSLPTDHDCVAFVHQPASTAKKTR